MISFFNDVLMVLHGICQIQSWANRQVDLIKEILFDLKVNRWDWDHVRMLINIYGSKKSVRCAFSSAHFRHSGRGLDI